MSKVIVIPGADFSAHAVAQAHFPNNPCTGISLDAATHDFTDLNQAFQITPTVTPAYTDDVIVWSSSDTSIASVINGVVGSVGVGTAVITATCGEFSASCTVTVQAIEHLAAVVAGYWYRSASTGTGTGDRYGAITKYTEISRYYVLAGNKDSGYKITSSEYESVDTSPWRFVPIPIPAGTHKITITAPVGIKTNTHWINKDLEASWGGGARILSGLGGTDYEQDNYVNSIEMDVPDDLEGVNSFAIGMYGDSSDAAYMTPNEAIEGFTIVYSAS